VAAGLVAGIWRHPVKSMQGEGIDADELTAMGLANDRAWGVVADGQVLSAKREPMLLQGAALLRDGQPVITLPDGSELVGTGEETDAALSAWLGRPVRLAAAVDEAAGYQMNVNAEDDSSPIIDLPCPPGTYFDALPVHVLTTASLRAMTGRYSDGAWDVRRFRPTVLVEVDGDDFAEDEWIGQIVRVGEAALLVVAPTVRCVMTTRAQPGGLERDLDIVKTINHDHQSNLGVYAAVAQPGAIAVGDAVEVDRA
jgi:uncharacterized protein YcbX